MAIRRNLTHRASCIPAAEGVLAVRIVSGRTFERHTHEDYGVGVVERGGHRSASGRGQVEAGPGDVITVNPGEVHDGAPAGAARAWRILYFEPQGLAAAWQDLTGAPASRCEFTTPTFTAPGAGMRVRRLFDAYTGGGPEASAAREPLLLEVLAQLCGPAAETELQRSGRADVTRARQIIDDDPATLRDLAVLGEAAGLSRFQVLRAFVGATGLTPHAYQTQKRVEAASRLIRGGARLVDAATAAGFADQSHMNRAFVRRLGYTPGALARALR